MSKKMFVYLLFCATFLTAYCAVADEECDRMHYLFALVTQSLLIVNLKFCNVKTQVLLHDVFAYILGYGLLVSECTAFRCMTSLVAITMIITRIYFNKCLFMWWNTERNIDTDMFVFILLCFNMVRRSGLLPSHICLVMSYFSHFIPDKKDHSVLLRTLRYMKSM